MVEEGFWETLHLLIEYKKTGKDARDEVEDWVNRVIARKKGLNEILDDEDVSMGSNASFRSETSRMEEIKRFRKDVNLPPIVCKFKYPLGKSRVEKLMGSNMVSLTDRNYMQKLQNRIVLDYAQNMNKRISTRRADELERVKNLVLLGKIPLEDAPAEMANHPVMLIERYCRPTRRSINDKRARKGRKSKLTNRSFFENDITSAVDAMIDSEKPNILSPVENDLQKDNETVDQHFEYDEIELVKYENPLIRELRNCETVEEMYALAEEIIGILKCINAKPEENSDVSIKN